MSQINKTAAQAPIITLEKPESYGRAIATSMAAAVALAAAGIAFAFVLTAQPSPTPALRTSTSQLTDGYLPGAIAAHQTAKIANAQALNDGWQGRLSAGGATATVALKEGGRLGMNPVTTNVIDGWAGLIPR
ncbi:MAG: hypothetical protein ABJC24_09160 [Chloroflexota bacterium]